MCPNKVLLLTLFFFVSPSSSSSPCVLPGTSDPATTCDQCLSLWPTCHWCPYRASSLLPAEGCVPVGQQCGLTAIRPRPKVLVIKDEPLSQVRGGHVQLRPQRVRLIASPGSSAKLGLTAALADVAVDLYFVMDLSNSMQVHQANLVQAAEAIADRMTSLTSDCRFGFGSFSDKPMAPFASELSFYLDQINKGRRKQPPPYSYIHQLSLTSDVALFRERVKTAPLAANIDSPESGLEALMQAVVCDELVGWRSGEVRRVVVFITDEDSHVALDAKMAGLVDPNDMRCHTNNDDGYTMEMVADYPSLSQIREALRRRNVAVVFAVDAFMHNLYADISNFVQGSERIGHLTRDSRSLEAIIEAQYRAIKSRLKLEVSGDADLFVDVDLTSYCDQVSDDHTTCFNVTEGENINFEVDITLKRSVCHSSEREKSFSISLSGFPEDRLEVELECEQCDCSDSDTDTADHDVCHGKGALVCGGCECRTGHTGAACECTVDKSVDNEEEDNARCLDNDNVECSHNGRCVCGRCQCDSDHLGDRCHCNRADCPSSGNAVCNGHGTCHCDNSEMSEWTTRCECVDGWGGVDCSCPLSDAQCRDVFSGQVCLNRGECVCGQCECDEGFEGKFCQRSETIADCQLIQDCVKFHQFHNQSQFKHLLNAYVVNDEWREKCLSLAFVSSSLSSSSSSLLTEGFVHDFIHVACASEEAADVFLYDPHSPYTDCTMAKRSEMEVEESQPGRLMRGDQLIESVQRYRKVFTSDLERCVASVDNCDFVFYHDHLLTDHFFQQKSLGEVFVVHRNVSGVYQSLTTCRAISLAVVLVTSGGLLIFVGLALIVAMVVVVNLNDLRRWQQYLAWLAENEQRLGDHENPLYQDKRSATTNFNNPAFKKQ